MKLIRVFFWVIFAVAVYDVAACIVTQVNPLSSLVIGMIAASSAVLVDYLEREHNRRIVETRTDTWARRDRDGFSA